LASIARTYDCSPPAISYIVSRSRARNTTAEATAYNAPSAGEPQLIKTHGGSEESRSNQHASDQRLSDPPVAPSPATAASGPVETPRPAAERPGSRIDATNGQVPRAGGAENPSAIAERRTLHLSLGNGAHGNGGGSEPQSPAGPPRSFPAGERLPPRPGPGLSQGFVPAPRHYAATSDQNGANGAASLPPVHGAASERPPENGAFIDRSLRERVDTDIAAFLAAFDTALDHDTPESRAGLREATDRLLRAGARTRIELERLEARLPLPSRERPRESGPTWPHR
jgi:hypothetical protein